MSQWSDTDKAMWIIEHGQYVPEYQYYYARSTGCFYRVHIDPPPWIPRFPELMDEPSGNLNGSSLAWVAESYETEHDIFREFQQ